MAQRTVYGQARESASLDLHEGCEARVKFFTQQLVDVLQHNHDLRRERDLARRQVVDLEIELAAVRGEP